MTEFKFKKNIKPIYTSDVWYDITLGGYINPEYLLESYTQAQKVEEALSIVQSFLDAAHQEGVIEVG